jgi:molybdopterin-guanine dinucleotide biosynthesis protein A
LTHQILPNKRRSELDATVIDQKGSAGIVELEFSDSDLDLIHESMSNELPETKMVIHEIQTNPVVTKIDKVYASSNSNIEAETVPFKPSMFDLIPWSSLFGILASLMAIASAWFIWNSIQKPIAIDEFIDRTIAPTVQVVAPVSKETAAVELNLSPSEYIASSIVEEANSSEQTKNTFVFSNLSERSKVSAVELEKLGLITLDIELGFFEEPIF